MQANKLRVWLMAWWLFASIGMEMSHSPWTMPTCLLHRWLTASVGAALEIRLAPFVLSQTVGERTFQVGCTVFAFILWVAFRTDRMLAKHRKVKGLLRALLHIDWKQILWQKKIRLQFVPVQRLVCWYFCGLSKSLRTTNLFRRFPDEYNNVGAWFDVHQEFSRGNDQSVHSFCHSIWIAADNNESAKMAKRVSKISANFWIEVATIKNGIGESTNVKVVPLLLSVCSGFVKVLFALLFLKINCFIGCYHLQKIILYFNCQKPSSFRGSQVEGVSLNQLILSSHFKFEICTFPCTSCFRIVPDSVVHRKRPSLACSEIVLSEFTVRMKRSGSPSGLGCIVSWTCFSIKYPLWLASARTSTCWKNNWMLSKLLPLQSFDVTAVRRYCQRL